MHANLYATLIMQPFGDKSIYMKVCFFLCTSRKHDGKGGTELLILNLGIGWKER